MMKIFLATMSVTLLVACDPSRITSSVDHYVANNKYVISVDGYENTISGKIVSNGMQNGIRDRTLPVDFRDLLLKLNNIWNENSLGSQHATIYFLEIELAHYFSKDTGSMSMKAHLDAYANIQCDSQTAKNRVKLEGVGRQHWTHFLPTQVELDQSLVDSTNDAIFDLFSEVEKVCSGENPISEVIKQCPPGWIRQYDGCNPSPD